MMKKYLVVLVCFALSVSFANAQSRELISLQEILQTTNATWTAAETEISQMSPIDQEKLLGLLPGIGNMEALPAETVFVGEILRDSHESPHTSIKNQGQCGSCYAFGACATYEGFKLLKTGKSYDLSEQYFMMKAKAIGPHGGCSGWYLDTSMNLLKNNGVCDESCCPYKAAEAACPSSCQPTHKIGSYSITKDLNTLKKAVRESGLVYVGFAVYNDFTYYSGGIYRYTSGSLRGYHAVAVVGYDESNKCFKVKNSWGSGWGEKGYFRIGYDQMTNSVQFGTCFGGSYYITN
jgi:C1A family cysteine protease